MKTTLCITMKLLLHLVLFVCILNNNGYTLSNLYRHYHPNENCKKVISCDYYNTDQNTCFTIGRNITLLNISSNIDVYSYTKHPLIFFDFKTEESNAYLNNESGHDVVVIRGIPKYKKNFIKYEIRQRKPN